MTRPGICLILLAALAGCANKGGPTTVQHLEQAAVNAATHPLTWAPLAAAGVTYAAGWDEPILDYAVENQPVFGSDEKAQEASDHFRGFAEYSMLGTALMVYDPEKGYWIPMLERQLVQHSAAVAAILARRPIKSAVGRDRPNGGPDSMPSGHATRTFANIGSTNRNLNSIPLHPTGRLLAKSSQVGVGLATAWARVEYEHHYPSDVLAGAALGNFVAIFINDAILGAPNRLSVTIPEGGGYQLNLNFFH